jgi:hypothetical protein
LQRTRMWEDARFLSKDQLCRCIFPAAFGKYTRVDEDLQSRQSWRSCLAKAQTRQVNQKWIHVPKNATHLKTQ